MADREEQRVRSVIARAIWRAHAGIFGRLDWHRCPVRAAQSRQRGWYMLESSLLIFGIAALVLGAADVLRIFHARAAVRQGVTDGLRCLYPSAERCTLAAPAAVNFNVPLFRSFVQQTVGFQLPRSDYRLSTGWFDEPILSATRINRRLTGADVLYGRAGYQAFDVKFPVEAHAMYLVQTRSLPWVELSSNVRSPPNLRVLQARVVDRNTRAEVKPLKVVNLKGIREVTTSRTPVSMGRVEFTLDDAWSTRSNDLARVDALRSQLGFRGAIPCYQGPWRQDQGGPVVEWQSGQTPPACRYHGQETELFDGSDVLVPVMIRITGDRYDTIDPSTKGVVSAELRFQSGRGETTQNLGGREFQANSTNANFVIRGVGQGFDADDSYFKACKDANYEECEKYSSLVLVPRGVKVSVHFSIKRTKGSGTVGWGGDSMELYYPQFALGHEKRDCGSSNAPHVCSQSVAPMQPLMTRTVSSAGITSEKAPNSTLTCLRSAPEGSYPSHEAALATLKQEFSAGSRELAATRFVALDQSGVACEPERRVFSSCEDRGVSDYRGCQKPLDYGQAEIIAKCSIPDFQGDRDTIASVRTGDTILTEQESRAACSAAAFPECARAELRQTGMQFLTDAESTTCQYAVPQEGPVLDSGPMYDMYPNPSCADPLKELKQEYRKKYPQVPAQVSIDSKVKTAEPESASAPPGNPCQKYEQGAVAEELCASGVALHVAEQCCTQSKGTCRIENVSPGGSSGSEAVMQRRVALALLRTEETVRTAYPRVKSVGSAECKDNGSRCLQVQGTTLDNATRVQVSASMQVPLVLFKWLGMQEMSTVQHSETRTLESALMSDARL